MKDNKIVSVIIPVYNTEKYLAQCIESVIDQSYKDLQIIIIDDGSTKECADLCDKLALRDMRIQVVHKKNEGLGLTRNEGLRHATGSFVTFLDSDDWFLKDHIHNLVEAITTGFADVVIGSRTKFFDGHKTPYKRMELSMYGDFCGEEVENIIIPEIVSASPNSKIDLGIPMSVCFNLYRTNIVRENGLCFPSERYCVSEDFFFNYKYLNLCKKVVLIKEYGYVYRNTPMSISHSFNEVQIERVNNFYLEIQKMVLNSNTSKELEQRGYRCCLSKIRSLLTRLCTSSLPFNQKIKCVKRIIKSNQVKEMLNKFDYRVYPFGLMVFTIAMKYRCAMVVYILLRIKNNCEA